MTPCWCKGKHDMYYFVSQWVFKTIFTYLFVCVCVCVCVCSYFNLVDIVYHFQCSKTMKGHIHCLWASYYVTFEKWRRPSLCVMPPNKWVAMPLGTRLLLAIIYSITSICISYKCQIIWELFPPQKIAVLKSFWCAQKCFWQFNCKFLCGSVVRALC